MYTADFWFPILAAIAVGIGAILLWTRIYSNPNAPGAAYSSFTLLVSGFVAIAAISVFQKISVTRDGLVFEGRRTDGFVINGDSATNTNSHFDPTKGTFGEYRVGSNMFVRVLTGTTGTRSFLKLKHYLPVNAVVISVTAAIHTLKPADESDQKNEWQSVLPIPKHGNTVIDSDVNTMTYRAGWDDNYAFAQFPIDTVRYGQRTVVITVTYLTVDELKKPIDDLVTSEIKDHPS